MTDKLHESDTDRRVVWLRRTHGAGRPWQPPTDPTAPLPPSAPPEDDYRHRMITNGIVFAICVVLVVVGVWLANVMAEMRKNQDCVLSGRRGCTPVDVTPAPRY